MLSVIDVIKALTMTVEARFPDYPVNDRDLEEGFFRPSYFIEVEEVRGENITAALVKETADLSLFFFEEDVYSGFLKLLEMKNELLELLGSPLALTDDTGKVLAHVTFNEVRVSISKADKALSCTMTSELVQARPDEDADLPDIDDLYLEL